MILSFIMTTQLNESDFKKTLKSIKNQTLKNYELIIVVDSLEEGDDLIGYKEVRKMVLENNNIKLIKNSLDQGKANCWNDALNISEGEYVKFINDGEVISDNFVEDVATLVETKNSPDMIEFTTSLKYKTKSYDSSLYVRNHKVYELKTEFEPFAYTSELIFNKIFRRAVIVDNSLKFRRNQRYDLLFVYKFLALAETYIYVADEIGSTFPVRPVDYSVFDTVNQWTHVFNYFREINNYKSIEEYVKYAYYKLLVHRWLWNLQWEGNKVLIKKGIDFVDIKFKKDKRIKFMKTNKVFLKGKDQKFQDMVENFESHIKIIGRVTK
ncbi:glycosyltransferase family 2 protein [Spiroplasma endosymbiont of Othius punctulatus]|uniref:glycosyltransferase family 2 protein n=1 Tax=Spiroplasma endosymbiont of Othius punctulatus TaxID=3066289 RepID=UPI0030D5E6A8